MSLELLPVEWEKSYLDDVIDVIRGITYKKQDASDTKLEKYLPVLRANSIQNGQILLEDLVYINSDLITGDQLIKKDDILVAMSSGSKNLVGKSAIAKEDIDAGFGAFCAILRPCKLMQSKYVGLFTFSVDYRNKISELSAGANINNLKPSHFSEIPFPIPPLAEQQEIVRQLDVMLAQVEHIKARLDAIPAILKKFRQSVLADAVSGKLTEEWRNKQKNLTNWISGELRDFVEKPIYGTSAKSSKIGEVPVLRMGNLQQGEIDWTDLVYTSDATEISKYDLKLNDLLFNRTNSPELVGKTSIYRGDKQAIFAGYLIRIRCLATLNPEFLNYHLNSHIGRDYCYRVKTDGVSQSNINAQKLLAYPFNCPSIDEQKLIVKLVKEYLGLVDRIEQTVKLAQKRVNLLTQSILAKAFSGELTVEWREQHQELITGVNSAESLLAKIQAEREVSKLVKKGRKKVNL